MKTDPLDKLFSERIRRRAIKRVGGCERCLGLKFDIVKDSGEIFPAYMQLQCAHLTGRWRKSTRWDDDNGAGLCGGCHRVIDRDLEAKEEFIHRQLGGEGYDLLKARARTPARYIDKAAIGLYLKAKIEELKERR